MLFLITEFDRGGAERALYDLVRCLDRSRFAPQVASLAGEGYYSDKYRDLGIPVHHLGLLPPRGAQAVGFPVSLARTVLRLASVLRREHIQVLQTFLFHANLVGRIAAPAGRTAVVLGAVRTAEPRHLHTLLDGLTFALTHGEVCVSEEVRRFQAARAGLPLGRLFVIPNGVDPADFPVPAAPFGRGPEEARAQRVSVRKEMGLPSDVPVLVFVGRLCEAKDLPCLLKAFSTVARRCPQAVLVMAGDGPLAPAVRAMVRGCGLEGRVLLPGWLDNPGRLCVAADCFVLSSVVEGMPGALLEAMACGLPVVSTDAPGCAELVVDGETGFLVSCRDAAALSLRMLEVLENPARAAGMGAGGRARAFERFSLEGVARRYQDLCERLLHVAYAGQRARC